MERKKKLQLLSYLVMTYMLLAFTWWSVLLFSKNETTFEVQASLLRQDSQNQSTFDQSAEYQALKDKFKRQQWMILGEVSFFVLSLGLGMWLIHRAYRREVSMAGQMKNFILSITHELNSPLAGLRLYLDTLIRRNLSNKQQKEISLNAVKDLERLQSQVDNLLMAARLESQYEPVFESIRLYPLVKEITGFYRLKNPDFNFVVNVDEELAVRAEKSGINTILHNLIENAIKYSGDHKEVVVEAAQSNDFCILCIKDRGLGIPDREKSMIFERFYRIGSEETRTTKGTGLGLYIVRKIVENHYGKIRVRDNEPRGSVIEIQLPLNPER
jgi:two-component system phosphate regulon sensor histidine kinase PhoR